MILKTIREWIRLFKIKNKEPYLSLHRMLGFYPSHSELYEQAFIHSSVRSMQEGKRINNERLEFLGDAILSAIVSDILYKRFSEKREGFLTNTRAKIVQRESLNKIALELGIDKKMNSLKYALHHNKNMLGNAFEALVGAIYLDKGYRFTEKYIEHIIEKHLQIDKIATREVNFKSRLLEWGQKNKTAIAFELVETTVNEVGVPLFRTNVLLAGTALATGVGNTKKESQQIASKIALRKLKKDNGISGSQKTSSEVTE